MSDFRAAIDSMPNHEVFVHSLPLKPASRPVLVSEPHWDKLCEIRTGRGEAASFDDVISYLLQLHENRELIWRLVNIHGVSNPREDAR